MKRLPNNSCSPTICQPLVQHINDPSSLANTYYNKCCSPNVNVNISCGTDGSCPVLLGTQCINYTGPNIQSSNIFTGQNLTTIIQTLASQNTFNGISVQDSDSITLSGIGTIDDPLIAEYIGSTTTPSLQEVTNVGNLTTNIVTVGTLITGGGGTNPKVILGYNPAYSAIVVDAQTSTGSTANLTLLGGFVTISALNGITLATSLTQGTTADQILVKNTSTNRMNYLNVSDIASGDDFILNQSTSPQTASFIVSGSGRIGTYMDHDPQTPPTYQEGRLWYDNQSKSMSYYDDIAGTSLQVNQEIIVRARNNTGSTILNGQVVYITGAVGQNPTIALGQSNVEPSSRILGMATHDIPNNAVGKVTTFGNLGDLDTSAFSDGDELWLSSTTPGAVTSTKPTSPNYTIFIGTVIYSHPTQGRILCHPQTGVLDVSEIAGNQIISTSIATTTITASYMNTNFASTPIRGRIYFTNLSDAPTEIRVVTKYAVNTWSIDTETKLT